MPFAPHHNGDVNEHNDLLLVEGLFRKKDTGVVFEFSNRVDDSWLPRGEYPHIIYTCDGHRIAKVLETVVYVVVDKDVYGMPVVEKWHIKDFRSYSLSWS